MVSLTQGFMSPKYTIDNGKYSVPSQSDLSASGLAWLAEQTEAREAGITEICEKPMKDGSKPIRVMAAIKYDMERAPQMTQGDSLRKLGLLPEGDIDPFVASDAEVSDRLNAIIAGLAFLHCFLRGTNKATDRELLRHLQDFVLRDVVRFVPPSPDCVEHIDLVNCFKRKKHSRNNTTDRDASLPKVVHPSEEEAK